MIDLSRILDGVFADFGLDEAGSFPTVPTPLPTIKLPHPTDYIHYSHTSHTSHTENGRPQKPTHIDDRNDVVPAVSARVASSYAGCVGSVGSVGREAKSLAKTTPFLFPQDLKNVGSVGSESVLCGRPILGLNRAAADPLPIYPSDVRAGIERELRVLAEDGRQGPDALRDAVEITRAKIRNSEALAERQAHGGRCHICDEAIDDAAPVVAVLSGKRGSPLFMHTGCCGTYTARRIALVDKIMMAAGYGVATVGEAA